MAHIPKRAAQHATFVPSFETSAPRLKPGQEDLHRQGLYKAERRPMPETYLTQDGFKESMYSKHISSYLCPDDFEEPLGLKKPFEFHTTSAEIASGTDHWRSEYAANMNIDSVSGQRVHRFREPAYAARNASSVVSRAEDISLYQDDYGMYGSAPMDKVKPLSDGSLPFIKQTPRTAGTTKGTNHIPGYQGFISGVSARAAGLGTTPRLVDKTNIAETFHLNVVGYAGHVPRSAWNDRGGRRISEETISGKDFAVPARYMAASAERKAETPRDVGGTC